MPALYSRGNPRVIPYGLYDELGIFNNVEQHGYMYPDISRIKVANGLTSVKVAIRLDAEGVDIPTLQKALQNSIRTGDQMAIMSGRSMIEATGMTMMKSLLTIAEEFSKCESREELFIVFWNYYIDDVANVFCRRSDHYRFSFLKVCQGIQARQRTLSRSFHFLLTASWEVKITKKMTPQGLDISG